jgi:predicted 3-demethylubiquinone-9 3-methyltransferase (glyoxalase superfamily)
MATPQKISPCLWFDHQAEEAAHFYISLFKNSAITQISRYGPGAPLPEGSALVVAFSLDGVAFAALNGGPMFTPNEAVSFLVSCDTQEEIDGLWDGLTTGGGHGVQCGWLKDRFGFSWQIVPSLLSSWMTGGGAAAQRTMAALMGMGKLDIAALEAAHRGP